MNAIISRLLGNGYSVSFTPSSLGESVRVGISRDGEHRYGYGDDPTDSLADLVFNLANATFGGADE